MAIKTIFCAASGGMASDGAVDLACRLAKRHMAHLEGFHVRLDPRELLAAMSGDGLGMGMAGIGGWMDQIAADAAELAGKTKTTFDAAAARHGLAVAAPATSASAIWREETGYAPLLVSRRARFFDLAVLGRSDRVVDRPHSDAVEQTLLQSGRPVLLAPAQAPAVIGETIAIGWNGSPQAVRALVAGLPLVAGARAVTIITIGDGESDAVPSVLEYLARHGIAAAKHRNITAVSGAGPGHQLLAAARDEGADLLVIGGYGHMPWRELLFGGATREIVGVSLMPVLLSH